jgi:hypothetical protein
MKNIKILIIAVICFIMLIMTACSQNIPASGISAAELVAKSEEAMKSVDNYRAVVNIEMSTDESLETAKMISYMDVFLRPLKIRMLSNLDEPTIGNFDMDTYFIQEENELAIYMNMNILDNWTKSVIPFDEDLASQFSPEYSTLFNEMLKTAAVLSSETINNIDCWKVKITLDSNSLTEILEGIQITEGLADEFNAELLSRMADVPVTVWIAKDSYYQVKVEMDISSNVLKEIGSDLSEIKISMTISDFGNARDFDLPGEAKDAV